MNKLVILLTLMLFGCSDNNEPIYDKTGNYGITVEMSDKMFVTFDEIVLIYEDTISCMGMTPNGPRVKFTSYSENNIPNSWARYYAKDKLVLVNTDEQVQGVQFPPRSKETDMQTIQHEFVHHILHQYGFEKSSVDHTNEMFKLCGFGVKLYYY